jgi:hypothetical protein
MPVVPIILALGGVGVVLLLVYAPVKRKLELQALKTRCGQVRAALSAQRIQGGDLGKQNQLEAELATCQQAMRDAGLEVDEQGELLQSIRDVRRQMRQEYTHFKSTDYSDILKRGSTRGAILRFGEELAQRYVAARAAAVEAGDGARGQLATLRREIAIDISDSQDRLNCYRRQGNGCDRYLGSTEDSPAGKVASERERVLEPLQRERAMLFEAAAEALGTSVADQEAAMEAQRERAAMLQRREALLRARRLQGVMAEQGRDRRADPGGATATRPGDTS